MKMNNVAILNHTLKILEKGYYITKSEKRVNLKMNRQQMKECIVYFPDEIHKLGENPKASHVYISGDLLDLELLEMMPALCLICSIVR